MVVSMLEAVGMWTSSSSHDVEYIDHSICKVLEDSIEALGKFDPGT